MQPERDDDAIYQWVETAHARGMAAPLGLLLDAVAPIAPLFAQAFWVAEPTARVFGLHIIFKELATALETPEELARLRQLLGRD